MISDTLVSKLLHKLEAISVAIRILRNWNVYLLLYFRILKNDPVLLLKNNLKIKLRTNSTDIYAFTNIWIWEEYKNKILSIGKNDIIIDIGAHIGLFSLYASQFCTDGKIYSFEPIKSNFDLLSFNINLNKIKNIKSFRKAVSDESGILRLYLSSDNAAHSIFLKGEMYEDVESTTLIEIMDSNEIEICNLLKLDCEGSEYTILNSLPESYFQRIQNIVMEYHLANERPELIKNLMNKLSSLNYQLIENKKYDDSGILFAIKKIKTSNNIITS